MLLSKLLAPGIHKNDVHPSKKLIKSGLEAENILFKVLIYSSQSAGKFLFI
jgi:hypothetical protein